MTIQSRATSTRSKRTPKSHWEIARKVVFAPARKTGSKHAGKETTLSIYFQRMKQDAMMGDIGATHERAWLIKYLEEKKILEQAAEVSSGSLLMKKRRGTRRKRVVETSAQAPSA